MSAARRAVPQRGQRGTIPASRLKNNPLRMRRRTARSAARRSVDAVTRFERVLAESIYLRSAAHVPFYAPLADNFGSVNRASLSVCRHRASYTGSASPSIMARRRVTLAHVKSRRVGLHNLLKRSPTQTRTAFFCGATVEKRPV